MPRVKPSKSKQEEKKTSNPYAGPSFADTMREVGPYMNMGFFFLSAIGLFTFIGYNIDQWVGGDPFYITWGAVLGVVVGMYNFFKTVLIKPDDKSEK